MNKSNYVSVKIILPYSRGRKREGEGERGRGGERSFIRLFNIRSGRRKKKREKRRDAGERERELNWRERELHTNNANGREARERELHINKRGPREGDRVGKSEREDDNRGACPGTHKQRRDTRERDRETSWRER